MLARLTWFRSPSPSAQAVIGLGFPCANVRLIRTIEMIIGYARVSTDGQTLDAQLTSLKAAGAEKVFSEKISGAVTDRKALTKAISALGPGGILLVTRLDRLARSTRDLLNILHTVSKAGAKFRSLADDWAVTTTPHGELMITILAGLATFERHLIKARTDEGRKRAQARGVRFGRPLKLSKYQIEEALYQSAEWLTLQGFPNRPRHDSRWQTEGVCHGSRYSGADGLYRRRGSPVCPASETRCAGATAVSDCGRARGGLAGRGGEDRWHGSSDAAGLGDPVQRARTGRSHQYSFSGNAAQAQGHAQGLSRPDRRGGPDCCDPWRGALAGVRSDHAAI